MQNKVFGALKSPHDPRDIIYKNIKPVTAKLPSQFLLDEWPVNDQGKFGSCVGQACSGIKDWQESCEWGERIDTSPLFVYSLCKQLDGTKEPGTFPRVAMKVLQKYGICLEKTMPYHLLQNDVSPKQPPAGAKEEAEEYKVKSYAKAQTIDEIKQAIKEDGPVLAAFFWIASMSVPEPGGFVPMPRGFIMGGHAVTVTGWDDNLEHTYKEPYKGKTHFKGFFRVRNSWGPEWGDNGYCWMPYDLFTESCDISPYLMEAWTAVDMVVNPDPGPRPKPEPDPGEDKEMREFDVAPTVIEGRTMLEVRELAELTGAEYVDWKAEKQEVIIYYPGRIIYMNIGKKKYRVVPR